MMSIRPPRAAVRATILCFLLWALAASALAQTASGAPQSFQELVTDIQRMLTELGYRPGGVDGKMGERTRQAIRRYQSNTGLPVDGHPSQALRQHLLVTTGAAPSAATPPGDSAGASRTSQRKAAWRGETVSDALLRIAPSDTSASRRGIYAGTSVDVIRRQGRWLEVRIEDDAAEGWVKQASVRPLSEAAAAPKEAQSGGFFAGLARGITRLLGGSSDAPRDQGSVTVGIRGLAPEDLASAIPDAGELDEMESYRADDQRALRFAAEERLSAQTVDYFDPGEPGAAAVPASGAAGRN